MRVLCFQLPLGQWGQTQQETPTVTAEMGEVLQEESPLGENEDGPLKTGQNSGWRSQTLSGPFLIQEQ